MIHAVAFLTVVQLCRLGHLEAPHGYSFYYDLMVVTSAVGLAGGILRLFVPAFYTLQIICGVHPGRSGTLLERYVLEDDRHGCCLCKYLMDALFNGQ